MKWSINKFFILETGLIAAIVAAPVLFGSVYAWASMLWLALLFFLLFLHPEALFNFQKLPRVFSCGMLSLFSFLLIQILFTSLNRYATAQETLKWLGYGCGFLLVQLLPQGSVLRLASAFVLVGVMESLYGFFQMASGHERVLWQLKESHLGFLTGTYLNRNHLAGLLELASGVSVGLWLMAARERKITGIAAFGICSLLIFAGLLRTGSRTGVLCAAFTLLLFLIFSVRKLFKKSFLFFNVFFVFLAGVAWASRHVLLARFLDPDDRWLPWQNERWFVWRDTFKMLLNHSWFGIGLGAFERVFPAYQSGKVLMGWTHAHQDYLELAAGLGVPAFMVLVLSWSGLLFAGVSKLKTVDRAILPLIMGIFVSLGSFLLHGLTDFNFAIPANAMLFVLAAAMMNRLVSGSSGKEIRP